MEKKQLIDTIDIAIQTALANLHTATIARVESVGAKTISVRPVINRVVKGQVIQLPEFTEVPPVFMQGGSSYTAHPIAVGDYCLLVLTERCFDAWYEGQDFRQPAEFRMHDYSDGLAIVGVLPRGGAITIPDVITQIGDTYQEGNYEHVGNRTQEGDLTRTGNKTQTGNDNIDGNSTVTGTVAASNFTGLNGSGMTSNVNLDAVSFSVGGQSGASGTFQSADNKTITVVNGLVVEIS